MIAANFKSRHRNQTTSFIEGTDTTLWISDKFRRYFLLLSSDLYYSTGLFRFYVPYHKKGKLIKG